eukprot:6482598-Amphidinium_carterae.1
MHNLGERLVDREWLDAEVSRLVGQPAPCMVPGSLHARHGTAGASSSLGWSRPPAISSQFSLSSNPGVGCDTMPPNELLPMSSDFSWPAMQWPT